VNRDLGVFGISRKPPSPTPDSFLIFKPSVSSKQNLLIPLVTIHTTADEIVPFVHETLYLTKVDASGSSLLHTNFPDDNGIVRYGHCNFTVNELLTAFRDLVAKVTTQQLTMN